MEDQGDLAEINNCAIVSVGSLFDSPMQFYRRSSFSANTLFFLFESFRIRSAFPFSRCDNGLTLNLYGLFILGKSKSFFLVTTCFLDRKF